MAPRFDLQSHSRHSDGALEAGEVVRAAGEEGIELLALSDHDTVDGVDEALAVAGEVGVALVPAAELSAVHGDHQDLHVLGYRLDHHDGELLDALADFRADRERRADRMAQRLGELGFAVDDELLDERRRSGKPIGRPHLAQAVISDVNNEVRLEREGIDEFGDFIAAYLVPGKEGFLPRTRPTVPEAIAVIHAAGGVAVWAHPFWDVSAPEEVVATIDAFRADGLDGVEAFYATHTREQTELLAGACAQRGLLSTGSADFHGPDHKHFAHFGAFELYGLEPDLGPIAG
ncbi:MAG TPA: PHP domain-containing protein [Solirubrobacteraceae bacterium]|nr:PHP domain-containing protein [Solirubrobacteraceae bacterium]